MDKPIERQTKTKEAVSQVLQSFAAPIALTDLYQFIKQQLPKTAFSTIFRILTRLEEEKKVIRIHWQEKGSRYEWADLPHHHHLVCEQCGTVTDITDQMVNFNQQTTNLKIGWQVNHHSIELFGHCPKCQRR